MCSQNSFTLWGMAILILTIATPSHAVESDDSAIIEALIDATDDDEPAVRVSAFKVLRNVTPTDAVKQAFHDGLDDEDAAVWQIALDGYIQIQGASDEVIRLLLVRLKQSDEQTSSFAQSRLVAIGESVVPKLVELIEQPIPQESGGHLRSKKLAIEVLGDTDLGAHRAKAINTLITATKAPETELRLEAIAALSKLAGVQETDKYRRYVTSLIKRFDKNADGVLTEDELGSKSRPFFNDMNKDGRITAAEVLNAIKSRQSR